MTVLVVGGNGFIGSHVVARLRRANVSTATLDLLVHGEQPAQVGVGLSVADACRIERVRHVFAQVEPSAVLFMATRNVRLSLTDPRRVADTNVQAALTCAQVAAERKVERYVYVSSSEVYGTAVYDPMDEEHPTCPQTIYGATKLAGEHIATAIGLQFGLPATVLRPFNALGAGAHADGDAGEVVPRWIRAALRGEPLRIHGDGAQARDFTEVGELADGIVRAADCAALVGTGPVNLGSERAVSLLELAEIVRRAVQAQTGFLVEVVHGPPRACDLRRQRASAAKAACLLGWRASRSVESVVGEMVQEVRTCP